MKIAVVYLNLALAAANDDFNRARKISEIKMCLKSTAERYGEEINLCSVVSCAYIPKTPYTSQVELADAFVFENTLPKLILFPSLSDISKTLTSSITAIQRWINTDNRVYLTNYSCQHDTEKYLTNLIRYYRYEHRKTYSPKVPKSLLEYAVDLRYADPPVKYNEIQKYMGIDSGTVIRRIGKELTTYANGRLMTQEERDHISTLRREHRRAVCRDFIIYPDHIKASDVI